MAKTFEVGDCVQLKSGGQKMTVERIEGDEVLCAWSDGKRVYKETFVADALKKYVPQKFSFKAR